MAVAHALRANMRSLAGLFVCFSLFFILWGWFGLVLVWVCLVCWLVFVVFFGVCIEVKDT